MPKGVQLLAVNPLNPAQLPPTADPGTKIFFLDVGTGKFFSRDEFGVDVLIGEPNIYIHNPVVTSASSPYNASYNETVKVNPLGVTGVNVVLPTPVGNAGIHVQVVNVTNVENPDALAFSSNVITVTSAVGTINGNTEDVLSRAFEGKVYESDGTNWIIVPNASAEGGGAGTLTLIDTPKRIAENTAMLYSDDVIIEDGDLTVEGDLQPVWSVDNHAVHYIPIGSERVIQQQETMFYTDLVIDGTLTVDGVLEDITPPAPPTPPTVGELGGLEITTQPSDSFTAVAGALYKIDTAALGVAQITLPAAPADRDTVGLYIGIGFVELELQLVGGTNNISVKGFAPSTNAGIRVNGGELLLLSWDATLAVWDVYGSPFNRLGGVVQTTDATPTAIASYATINDSKVIELRVEVLAYDTSTEEAGHWIVEVTAKRDILSTVTIPEELFVKVYKDDLSWDVQFSVSGTSILVEVVGDVGNTIDWRLQGTVKENG